MARIDKESEERLQPKRIEFAKIELSKLGYEIIFEDKTEIRFMYKNNIIKFWPYSGWHQGKGIKSGRGLNVLLNKLIP